MAAGPAVDVAYASLAVSLETRPGSQWVDTKLVKFSDAITCGEMAASLATQYLGVVPRWAPYFALVLEDANSIEPSSVQGRNVKVSVLRAELRARRENRAPGKWRAKLRMVVMPASIVDLMDTGRKGFEYFFAQLVNDYMMKTYRSISIPKVIELGSLLIRAQCLLGEYKQAGIDLTIIAHMEREIGFAHFIPEDVIASFGSIQKFRIELIRTMQRLCAPLLTQQQCFLKFIEILDTEDFYFGLHTFEHHMKGHHRRLVIDPVEGIKHGDFSASPMDSTALCSFERFRTAVHCEDTTDDGSDTGFKKVVIGYVTEAGGAMQVEPVFTDHRLAERFCVVADLYRAVYAPDLKTDTPVVPVPLIRPIAKPRPASSLMQVPDVAEEPVGGDSKFMTISSGDFVAEGEDDENATEEDWEIPSEQVDIGVVIGHGQFGDVSKGTWKDSTGTVEVALKGIKDDSEASEEKRKINMQEFMDEAQLQRPFNHPGIVKLHGLVYKDSMPLIVLELCMDELRNFLMSNKKILKKTTLCMQYTYQVARAMEYLHARKILHRDLAARNILVKSPEVAKVADFGLSRYCEDVYQFSDGKMPIKWMAPESVNFRRHTSKSDVWMFGVCCWEIMSYGTKPFQMMKASAYVNDIQRGIRLTKPLGCPKPLYAIMYKCWQYESSDRPTFVELAIDIKKNVLDKFPTDPIDDETWEKLDGPIPRQPVDAVDQSGSVRSSPMSPTSSRNLDAPLPPPREAASLGIIGMDADAPDPILLGAQQNASAGAEYVNAMAEMGILGMDNPPPAEELGFQPALQSDYNDLAAEIGIDAGVLVPQPAGGKPQEYVNVLADMGIIGMDLPPPPSNTTRPLPDYKKLGIVGMDAPPPERPPISSFHTAVSQNTAVTLDSAPLTAAEEAIQVKLREREEKLARKAAKQAEKDAKALAKAEAKRLKLKKEAEMFAIREKKRRDEEKMSIQAEEEDAKNDDRWPPQALDLNVELRSVEELYKFGPFSWTVFGGGEPDPVLSPKERLVSVIPEMIKTVSRLKMEAEPGGATSSSGEGSASGYVGSVLKLSQQLNLVVDMVRERLGWSGAAGTPTAKVGLSLRSKIKMAARPLGPKFRTLLDSCAEAKLGYGEPNHEELRSELLSNAQKILLNCIGVVDAADEGTGSYAKYAQSKQQTSIEIQQSWSTRMLAPTPDSDDEYEE